MLLSLIHSTRETLLSEGIQDQVRDMFSVLPEPHDVKALFLFNSVIDRANARGKLRHDQMVWVVRWFRLEYAFINKSGYKELEETFERLSSDISKKTSLPQHTVERYGMSFILQDTIDLLLHYKGIQYEPIQDYRFSFQSYAQVEAELKTLEKEYQAKVETGGLKPQTLHEVVLDMGEYVWYNLNTPACDEEASVMGHCGNSGGAGEETILSLRQRVKDGYLRPVLTFILDLGNGYLGERKARFNEKPEVQYHPYIIQLLKHPMIKGIQPNAGYKPENNFELEDLNDRQLRDLLNTKLEIFHEEQLAISMSHLVDYDTWFKAFRNRYGYNYHIRKDGDDIEMLSKSFFLRPSNLDFISFHRSTQSLRYLIKDVIEHEIHSLILNATKNIDNFISFFTSNDDRRMGASVFSKIGKLSLILGDEEALIQVHEYLHQKASRASVSALYIQTKYCHIEVNADIGQFGMRMNGEEFKTAISNREEDQRVLYIINQRLDNPSVIEAFRVDKEKLINNYDDLIEELEDYLDNLITARS